MWINVIGLGCVKLSREYSKVPESREIIEIWFNKSKNGNNPLFDKFISLWISFNSFYTSDKRYIKARRLTNRKNIPEYLYLESFCSGKKYQNIYSDLLKNSNSFQKDLNYFLGLLEEKTRFKGKIADLRPDMRNREDAAQPFSDIKNFKEFIFVSYQIRCNLVHGNKSTTDDGDNDIVSAIYAPFIRFLQKVYENEGYLNNFE